MRAVLDPNVLVSAALSHTGAPAGLVREWIDGGFELVASAALLGELRRVLAYPKIVKQLSAGDAKALIWLIETEAFVAVDPGTAPPVHVEDPDDAYLITLALSEGAALVSGDAHLLDLSATLPIFSPADFLRLLSQPPPGS